MLFHFGVALGIVGLVVEARTLVDDGSGSREQLKTVVGDFLNAVVCEACRRCRIHPAIEEFHIARNTFLHSYRLKIGSVGRTLYDINAVVGFVFRGPIHKHLARVENG